MHTFTCACTHTHTHADSKYMLVDDGFGLEDKTIDGANIYLG